MRRDNCLLNTMCGSRLLVHLAPCPLDAYQVQQTRGQAFEAGYSPVPRLFGSARSKTRGQSGKRNNGGGRNVGPHRNRQPTKRKMFSSSSRSNRGKRTLHGHGRDARGGVLLRSGSERRARVGSKHEQQLLKRVQTSLPNIYLPG